MDEAKMRFKIAALVCDSITALTQDCREQNESKISDTSQRITRLIKDSRLYAMAVKRHWWFAADKIQTRLRRTVLDLNYEVQALRGILDQPTPSSPNLSDILAELMQMEDEYGSLNYDPKEQSLTVVTDPITLEDVSLGSFQIQLFLGRIGRVHREIPYRVIALDPHPAGSDSGVTHPHVSGEHLCEGDGHLLIRKALEQGRLCDFFSIVSGILNTYNPDSPYVRLDDWDGYSCYDCGRTMSRDDSYYCEQCENDYCDQCSCCCQICDTTVCLGCATECSQCHKPVCSRCTAVCSDCQETLCKDCIDKTGICNLCQENRKEQENEDDSEQTNTTAA